MDGAWGIPGWRWLFVLEGIPSIVVGIAALWWLTERPQETKRLEPGERAWLARRMESEAATKAHTSPKNFLAVFGDPATLCLTLAKFLTLIASYGLSLWLPQIIKGFGNLSNVKIGLLTAIPSAVAVAASIAVGRHSDRTGERIWHIAMPAFVGRWRSSGPNLPAARSWPWSPSPSLSLGCGCRTPFSGPCRPACCQACRPPLVSP
jgi:ACS family tartrate transporter-like MFS transporter